MGYASEDDDLSTGVVWITVIIIVFFKHQNLTCIIWTHYIALRTTLLFDYLKKESDMSGMA